MRIHLHARTTGAAALAVALAIFPPRASAAEQRNDCTRASSLTFAAAFGDPEALRRLLDEGIGVNCDVGGETALIVAARSNKPANVAFLLAQGAKPEIRNADGRTALDLARFEAYTEVVRVLTASAAPASAAPASAAPASAAPASAAPASAAPASAAPASAAPASGVASPSGRAVPSSDVLPPRRDSTSTTPEVGGVPEWPPFGSYRVGDRVRFLLSTGWRLGTVLEVGTSGLPATASSNWKEKKYRIADDRYRDAGDWHDWGAVAGLERLPFWWAFFVGDWKLGEVMAVNTRTDGRSETTEYSYHTATEALRLTADGRYVWKGLKGEVRGRWRVAEDGPGIVLLRGVDGADWTLRNETNATTVDIRRLESARLTASEKMSIAATRPVAGRRR